MVSQPQRLGRTLLNACLLFSLAFFFVCKFSPAESHAGGLTGGSRYVNTFTWGHTGHFYRSPFNPKGSGPAWESLFESEDYNLKLGGWVCPPFQHVFVPQEFVADETLSALPPPFLQNRARIPLFVLHHSWKTFLH